MTPDPPHDPTAIPAPLPPTAALLHQTQTTLGLLRDVVQESSAEYWYERGKEASAAEDWEEAAYCFEQCVLLNSVHWQGLLQLAAALVKLQRDKQAVLILHQIYTKPVMAWDLFSTELTTTQWSSFYYLSEPPTFDFFYPYLTQALIERISEDEEILDLQLNNIYAVSSRLADSHTDVSSLDSSTLWPLFNSLA